MTWTAEDKAFTSRSMDEVEQGEQDDPDHVDDVPVHRGEVDRPEELRPELAAPGALQDPQPHDDAAQHVEAVQSGQKGSFVFTIENNIARVKAVKVMRTTDGEAVLSEGLNGDETVVTDGQLALRDGSRVDVKQRQAAGQ